MITCEHTFCENRCVLFFVVEIKPTFLLIFFNLFDDNVRNVKEISMTKCGLEVIILLKLI